MGLIDSLNAWLKHPFDSGQNAWQWVLFVGLLIIAAFFWQMVLIHIVRD